MNILESNKEKLVKACSDFHVNQLFVFGSVLSKNFSASSDLDFLVNFQDDQIHDYASNYYSFKFCLEQLFHRKIDLLEEESIKNPYLLKEINQSKVRVYG